MMSCVCRRRVPLYSQFLFVERGLKISTCFYSGVLDVEGGLNVSLAVLYGVPDVAVISGVCRRLIPLHSQFLFVERGQRISAGAHYDVLDVGGGLNVSLAVPYRVPDVAVILVVHSGDSEVDGSLKVSLVDYGVLDVAVNSHVCHRLMPLQSQF